MASAVQPIIVNSGSSSTGKLIGGVVILVGVIYVGKKAKDYLDKVKAEQNLKNDQASTVTPPKGHKVFYDLNGKPI